MASRLRCLLTGGLVALFAGAVTPALANSEVEKRAANPDTWGAPGRDNQLTRHSTLSDINTGNASKLQMAWSQSSGALRGHEGSLGQSPARVR